MQLKADALGWATAKVNEKICGRMMQLGHDTPTWRALIRKTKSVEPTELVDFMIHLWDACYGQFDLQYGWEASLEDEFMEMRGFSYAPSSSNKKGCIAKTITVAKTGRVKAINHCCSEQHGMKVNKSRSKSQMRAEGVSRFKKRPKGETLGCGFIVDGRMMSHEEFQAGTWLDAWSKRHKRKMPLARNDPVQTEVAMSPSALTTASTLTTASFPEGQVQVPLGQPSPTSTSTVTASVASSKVSAKEVSDFGILRFCGSLFFLTFSFSLLFVNEKNCCYNVKTISSAKSLS